MSFKQKVEIKPELKAVLDKYGIDPDDTNQVWSAHGTLVLCHKTFEKIAAIEKIKFDQPAVVNAIVRDGQFTVAMLVTGHLGDLTAWSFGEASDLNYRGSAKQALYPFAFAEKRAVDRVIAKLIGIAGWIYSEAEADEFSEAKPTGGARQEIAKTIEEAQQPPDKLIEWQNKVVASIANAQSPEAIDDLLERCQKGLALAEKDNKAVAQDIRARFTARKLILEKLGSSIAP